jgi:hypothetical protein
LACFITFFLRALEATEFTDLGIFLLFFVAGVPIVWTLYGLTPWLHFVPIYTQGLFQPQLLPDTVFIRFVDQGGMRQLKLPLFRLFGQDVTLEGVLSLDLSRTCQLETLLGTGFGLHFRHLFLVKIYFCFPASIFWLLAR